MKTASKEVFLAFLIMNIYSHVFCFAITLSLHFLVWDAPSIEMLFLIERLSIIFGTLVTIGFIFSKDGLDIMGRAK